MLVPNRYRIEGECCYLIVTDKKGKEWTAVFDADDFAKVFAAGKWRISTGSKFYHVIIAGGGGPAEKRQPHFKLHRLVMDAPIGSSVDILDGNGLDCRKTNLRVTDHQGLFLTSGRRTGRRNDYHPYIYPDDWGWRAYVPALGEKNRSIGHSTTLAGAVRLQEDWIGRHDTDGWIAWKIEKMQEAIPAT